MTSGVILRPGQLWDRDNNYPPEIKEELDNYLRSIGAEYKKGLEVIESFDVFQGHKDISKELRMSSYRMYFPMYKAGEIKYGIDWKWALIVHGCETGFSTHPNPWRNGFFGPLQASYDPKEIKQAINGWEILRLLPQRYTPKTIGFYDCDGIMTGMGRMNDYIRQERIMHPGETEEKIQVLALRWYCGDDYTKTNYGNERYKMWQELKKAREKLKTDQKAF